MRFIQLRSAPAQNAGPLPASTTARTLSSASSSRRAVVSALISASSKALRISGRSSVTRATAPLCKTFSISGEPPFMHGFEHAHILKMPKRVCSIGALRQAESARPSSRRVSAGSTTPSSQRRALE